ncbi:SepA family multidrug efflux transporter, partial [Staphylococcus saprophyticus]
IVHIHYTYIDIDFWVIVLIIGVLFICKEIFYPDSKNLNQKNK